MLSRYSKLVFARCQNGVIDCDFLFSLTISTITLLLCWHYCQIFLPSISLGSMYNLTTLHISRVAHCCMCMLLRMKNTHCDLAEFLISACLDTNVKWFSLLVNSIFNEQFLEATINPIEKLHELFVLHLEGKVLTNGFMLMENLQTLILVLIRRNEHWTVLIHPFIYFVFSRLISNHSLLNNRIEYFQLPCRDN